MPGIAQNEDSSHFFGDRPLEKMTPEGLKELVDHYATPQVKEILFNPNSMRISADSKAFDPIWKGFDPAQGPNQSLFEGIPEADRSGAHRFVTNVHRLFEQGIDPYVVWMDETRARGISPWISMRMNDLHNVDNERHYMHSDFWKQHPEFRRVTYRPMESWMDKAFDYGRQEVREYHLALVQDYLERYDMDGLELDWMRFGFHFRPGFEEQGRELLIEFHREVRRLADAAAQRRGHPIRIGVRVPSRPQTARGLGLDAVAWAREGLIDQVVITPFFMTIEFDMPVELWKDLLGTSGHDVTLAAGLEILICPTPKVWPNYDAPFANSNETVFGAAASLLHRGADRIYLFNYFDSVTPTKRAMDYRTILENAGELSTLTTQPRRYVVTYSDTWAPGEAQGHLLPAECRKGQTAAFRIPIGPRPRSGAAWVYVGLGEEGSLDADLEVFLNGVSCPASSTPAPDHVHPIVQKIVGFDIPLDALHDGYNLVEVMSQQERAQQIAWVEIRLDPR